MFFFDLQALIQLLPGPFELVGSTLFSSSDLCWCYCTYKVFYGDSVRDQPRAPSWKLER